MAIDLDRVIQATVDAVLEGRGSAAQPPKRSDKGKRHGLSVPRTFLIGAGVVTAGRLVAGLRSGDLLENLQQRLVDYEQRHFNNDGADEDEDFDEEDFDEEPQAEEDEDFDDEESDDEAPVAEEDESDEEPDEEPEAETDEEFEDEDEEFDEEPPDDEDEEGEDQDSEDEPEAEDEEDFDEEEPERPGRRRARSAQG